jgi:hypothetical protein
MKHIVPIGEQRAKRRLNVFGQSVHKPRTLLVATIDSLLLAEYKHG